MSKECPFRVGEKGACYVKERKKEGSARRALGTGASREEGRCKGIWGVLHYILGTAERAKGA